MWVQHKRKIVFETQSMQYLFHFHSIFIHTVTEAVTRFEQPSLRQVLCFLGQIKKGEWGQDSRPSPLKITSGYRFLRNTGTDPLKKQLDPLDPIASRGRFIEHTIESTST